MKRSDSNETSLSSSPRPRLRRNLIRIGALVAVLALGVSTAFLSGSPAARAMAMQDAGDAHASMFAMMHGGHTPEQMHDHFDKVLADAGVGDAQRQQIQATLKNAMTAEHDDMVSFHENLKQLRTLLSAPTIDYASVATVRAEQDRLMLATSHRLADTMIAVARALNPEQRAKLSAEIDQMMAQHGMGQHSP